MNKDKANYGDVIWKILNSEPDRFNHLPKTIKCDLCGGEEDTWKSKKICRKCWENIHKIRRLDEIERALDFFENAYDVSVDPLTGEKIKTKRWDVINTLRWVLGLREHILDEAVVNERGWITLCDHKIVCVNGEPLKEGDENE